MNSLFSKFCLLLILFKMQNVLANVEKELNYILMPMIAKVCKNYSIYAPDSFDKEFNEQSEGLADRIRSGTVDQNDIDILRTLYKKHWSYASLMTIMFFDEDSRAAWPAIQFQKKNSEDESSVILGTDIILQNLFS